MPDKHLGRDHLYESIEVAIYRKPWGSKIVNYELQAVLRGYFIKSRSEIPSLFKQIAQANMTQGFYDWGFRWKSLGHITRKAVEDLDWQTKENARKGIILGQNGK